MVGPNDESFIELLGCHLSFVVEDVVRVGPINVGVVLLVAAQKFEPDVKSAHCFCRVWVLWRGQPADEPEWCIERLGQSRREDSFTFASKQATQY